MKKTGTYFFLLGLALTLTASAQVPRIIGYQGVLTDASGNFIADGSHTLLLKLYDNLGATVPVYTESQAVPVIKGLFNVIIGSVTPIPASLAFDRAYFLGVAVDGGLEMAPRTPLSAVPYALHASTADMAATANALAPGATGVVRTVNGQQGAITLQGGGGTTVTNSGGTVTISSTGGGGTGIQGVQSSDGTISIASPNGPTANLGIADGAITNDKLASNSVTAAKIANGNVVKNLTVNGTPLQDDVLLNAGTGITLGASAGTITIGATPPGGVQALQNVNNTIDIANPSGPNTTIGLRPGSVDSSFLADGAVTGAKISNTGASSGQVLSYNGSNVVWAGLPPSGLVLPYANTFNEAGLLFSLTNTGAGKLAIFEVANAASGNYAVGAVSNGMVEAVYALQSSTTGTAPALVAESQSTAANAVGLLGRISATAPGGFSSGVRGINAGTGGLGIGVWGSHAGSGWGVYGTAPTGIGVNGTSTSGSGVSGSSSSGVGVFGITNTGTAAVHGSVSNAIAASGVLGDVASPTGAGVQASYTGSGLGTALLVNNGSIRLAGANKAAFVHTATPANKLSANGTDISNPMCDGDPNCIVLVTQKLNTATITYNNSSIGVYYTPIRNKWEIFNQNNLAIPDNAQFNVLVIKQ